MSYKQICPVRCEKSEQPQNHRLAEHWSWKVMEGKTAVEGDEMTLRVTEKLLPLFMTCDLNGNSLFLTLGR